MDSLTRKRILDLRIFKTDFVDVHIDDINLDTPNYLMRNPLYYTFLDSMITSITSRARDRIQFNYTLNERRVDPAVVNVIDWRLVRLLTLPMSNLQKHFEPNLRKLACFEQPDAMFDLIKCIPDRAMELKPIFERFVFVMAKVKAEPVFFSTGKPLSVSPDAAVSHEHIKSALKIAVLPYYESNIRQQMYFPDRKLVQFDSGKLQTLYALLDERKRGGHKCLIFTQMSKMLDILEAFLNLHGHTYVRLDGSTTVDRRQKLMDRFNNDPKLFCFILSTRSGGFGINLTGADSVIFYDSDWNPAMDA